MKKRRVYRFGLGNLVIGGLLIGFSLMQGGLSADSTTAAFDTGITAIKVAFIVGAILIIGGIVCFASAVMSEK